MGTRVIGKPECWLEPSEPDDPATHRKGVGRSVPVSSNGLRGIVRVPGYITHAGEVRASFEWNGEIWTLREIAVTGGFCHGVSDPRRALREAQVKVVAALDVLRRDEDCPVSTAAYWEEFESSCEP
jgi:hypothetical protein